MKDIYVFLHVCSLKRYKEIFNEVWQKTLPLSNVAKKIYISVVGPGRMEDIIPKNDKIELIHHSDDPEAHEFPTLRLIQKVCKENDCYVCYFHLRGVTSPVDNIPVVDQRHYMMYFNIECYETCIQYLNDGFDTVGVDLDTVPVYPATCYGGNFWWSKSDHINKLTNIEDLPEIHNFYSKHDKCHRHRCEMWVCSLLTGNYLSLWNTNITSHRYHLDRYPKKLYIGKCKYEKILE